MNGGSNTDPHWVFGCLGIETFEKCHWNPGWWGTKIQVLCCKPIQLTQRKVSILSNQTNSKTSTNHPPGSSKWPCLDPFQWPFRGLLVTSIWGIERSLWRSWQLVTRVKPSSLGDTPTISITSLSAWLAEENVFHTYLKYLEIFQGLISRNPSPNNWEFRQQKNKKPASSNRPGHFQHPKWRVT